MFLGVQKQGSFKCTTLGFGLHSYKSSLRKIFINPVRSPPEYLITEIILRVFVPRLLKRTIVHTYIIETSDVGLSPGSGLRLVRSLN